MRIISCGANRVDKREATHAITSIKKRKVKD
jgi:hypothetical protein